MNTLAHINNYNSFFYCLNSKNRIVLKTKNKELVLNLSNKNSKSNSIISRKSGVHITGEFSSIYSRK